MRVRDLFKGRLFPSINRLGCICLLLLMIFMLSCNRDLVRRRPTDDDKTAFLICSITKRTKIPFRNAERFGFFSSRLWQDYEENLRKEIDVFGAVPGYILWYLQLGEPFPANVAEQNKSLGIHTVINQDISNDMFTPERNEQLLKEIADGKWDDKFRNFAREARQLDQKVYYRFGYEMNGDWFPWGRKPKEYVDAWKHVWKLFRKEKADSVVWIFSPGVVWGQRTFKEDVLPYYPGKDYVDIVALDGYNFGDKHDRYHEWESFETVYSTSLYGLMNFGKPMWIAEIGCPSDTRRHQWLKEFLDFFDTNGCFDVFIWFNENKKGEPNFRIDGDAASLDIFREWVQRGNQKLSPNDDIALK